MEMCASLARRFLHLPGYGGGSDISVSSGSTMTMASLVRRRDQKNMTVAMSMTPASAPIPMPAWVPVLRPDEDSSAEYASIDGEAVGHDVRVIRGVHDGRLEDVVPRIVLEKADEADGGAAGTSCSASIPWRRYQPFLSHSIDGYLP